MEKKKNKELVFNTIQPNHLPYVTEKYYSYEMTLRNRIFNFLPYETINQKDCPLRHLGVVGLLYYKAKGMPVKWLIINKKSAGSGSLKNSERYEAFYDLPVTGHVEYQDFASVYVNRVMPEELYMTKEIWMEAFKRLYKEKVENLASIDQQKLNYTGCAFNDDIPIELHRNNIEYSELITYEITDEDIVYGKFKLDNKARYSVRWVTYSQLLYEYKLGIDLFDTGLKRVLNYFMKHKYSEQEIEREIMDITKARDYYYTATSWDSKSYIIHTGGPYQSPAGPFTDESDYYEIPEGRYTFWGTLDEARKRAEQIVENKTDGDALFKFGIKSLNYRITDENGTVYI